MAACDDCFKASGSGLASKTVLLEVLAACLHLGDIEIEEDNQDQAVIVQERPSSVSSASAGPEASSAAVSTVRLLRLPGGVAELEKALCYRTVTIAGSDIATPLTDLQAAANRDALAKAVYGWTFDWVVASINASIATVDGAKSASDDDGLSIAILDIYGFEVMQNNSLEQLLINLANENLQQVFNERVLLHEKMIYGTVGIEVDLSDSIRDDSATLALITGRSNGILRLLDEQNSLRGNGSDRSFIANLERAHGEASASSASSARYQKPKTRPEHFIVIHFAGSVMYDSGGMVAKNADLLSLECVRLLAKSSEASGDAIPGLGEHFSSLLPAAPSISRKAKSETPSRPSEKETVGRRFLRQLETLMESLRSSQNHYVRCIRVSASRERTNERPNDRTTERPTDRPTDRPNERTNERTNPLEQHQSRAPEFPKLMTLADPCFSSPCAAERSAGAEEISGSSGANPAEILRHHGGGAHPAGGIPGAQGPRRIR